MRKIAGLLSRKRAALAMIVVTAGLTHVFAGCGSDSNGPPAPGVDASNDAPMDASTVGDGSVNPNPVCKLAGQGCATSADCCTANCDATTNTCAASLTQCKAPAEACTAPNECCTGSCVNGACSDKQCVPDKPTPGACGQAGDCCSGICTNGSCASLNPDATCRTAGNPCGAASECCSNLCNNGICSSAVSFCVQQKQICSTNAECCGGNCVKQAGNITGVCGAPTSGGGVPSGCAPSGTVCASGGDAGADGLFPCDQNCCSRSCGYYGALSGFRVCQPPSGCRPTGEVCRADSDCCGWEGAPDPVDGPVHCSKASPTAEFGRCDNGGSCREPGSICKPGDGDSCSAENNCCEHSSLPSNYCNNNPENCCAKDSLGIPRCLIEPIDCADGGAPPAGSVCATSADCCGNPCIDNKCGGDGTCVPKGDGCTTNADCCKGLPCVAAPGSSKGVCGGSLLPDGGVSDAGTTNPDGNCALYGQLCNGASDCCNGVPCTDGRCRFP